MFAPACFSHEVITRKWVFLFPSFAQNKAQSAKVRSKLHILNMSWLIDYYLCNWHTFVVPVVPLSLLPTLTGVTTAPLSLSLCSSWMDVQVKGTSLPRALQCWERSLHHSFRNQGNSSISSTNPRSSPRGCPLHLIDSCPWPHCNPTCPSIRDLTGREMNVIQFLTHTGFDVQRMAQQQGLEPSKLLGMLNSDTWAEPHILNNAEEQERNIQLVNQQDRGNIVLANQNAGGNILLVRM